MKVLVSSRVSLYIIYIYVLVQRSTWKLRAINILPENKINGVFFYSIISLSHLLSRVSGVRYCSEVQCFLCTLCVHNLPQNEI